MLLKYKHKENSYRYETFLATDTASISLWQAGTFPTSLFNVEDLYSKYLNKVAIIETGRDGTFRIVLNYNIDLAPADKKIVSEKVLGIELQNAGSFYLGDGGSAGTKDDFEESAYEREFIDKIEFPEGKYILDIYSLVTRDKEGNPKFLQFALNLFTEERYPNKKAELINLDKHLDMRYKEE